ncbi:hypothetical protein BD779DRAFT_1673270 [Infundibulicybe gibba]|nr:hypothetical protein BD779DRAFT_1673270 [Infundibulicybe gibba]
MTKLPSVEDRVMAVKCATGGQSGIDWDSVELLQRGVKRSRAEDVSALPTANLIPKIKRPRSDSRVEARAEEAPTLPDSGLVLIRKMLDKLERRTVITGLEHIRERKHAQGTSSSKIRVRQDSDIPAGRKRCGGVVTMEKSVEGACGAGQASGRGGGGGSREPKHSGKGKHTEGVSSWKAGMASGDIMLRQGSDYLAGQKGFDGAAILGKSLKGSMCGRGASDGRMGGGDSSSKKTDDVGMQGSQCASPIPGPSQQPENIQALDQITGGERSPAEITAELTLVMDAIARHRAQIHLSSTQLSHLEILEKELRAKMDTPQGD